MTVVCWNVTSRILVDMQAYCILRSYCIRQQGRALTKLMMEAVGYAEISVHDRGAHPTNRNLKYTDFVDTMISNVLRDLSFSKNQPLKPTDDY